MEANILRILVVLVGVALVAVVLFQQPKEGGLGAFTGGGGGSGASSTVFGAKGSGNFLFRLTAGLVLAFAILIIGLVKVTNTDARGSVISTSEPETSTQVEIKDNEIPGVVAKGKVLDNEIPGVGPIANNQPLEIESADKEAGSKEKDSPSKKENVKEQKK